LETGYHDMVEVQGRRKEKNKKTVYVKREAGGERRVYVMRRTEATQM
jgi:hypothetical protein